MKTSIVLLFSLALSGVAHAQGSVSAEELSLAKSISEKLYFGMAQVLPAQLNEKDQLRSECGARDLYLTCVVTDDVADVGYTHGISVKFDHYGKSIAVNSIQYLEH